MRIGSLDEYNEIVRLSDNFIIYVGERDSLGRHAVDHIFDSCSVRLAQSSRTWKSVPKWVWHAEDRKSMPKAFGDHSEPKITEWQLLSYEVDTTSPSKVFGVFFTVPVPEMVTACEVDEYIT
nr:hypothetical protein CFP56_21295 [Quercus suber]